MPYIAIKSYPRDEATKQAAAERISALACEVLGCPESAITISYEEVAPADWEETVVKAEIEPKMEHVMILSGEKKF